MHFLGKSHQMPSNTYRVTLFYVIEILYQFVLARFNDSKAEQRQKNIITKKGRQGKR